MHRYLYQILKDNRITKTQKYIFLSILALDKEQNCPEKLELPIRSLEEYDIRGHGHIKPSLERLKEVGYLLEVSRLGRKDGYSVTTVVINRQLHQIFSEKKPEEEEEEGDKNKPKDVA